MRNSVNRQRLFNLAGRDYPALQDTTLQSVTSDLAQPQPFAVRLHQVTCDFGCFSPSRLNLCDYPALTALMPASSPGVNVCFCSSALAAVGAIVASFSLPLPPLPSLETCPNPKKWPNS